MSDSGGVARGLGRVAEERFAKERFSKERRAGERRLTPVSVDEAAGIDWPAVTAAFRAGDAAAADAVVGHLLPYVSRLVARLSAWRSDGDDLVQDVLVAALAKRASFRGDAKLETWITRIAVNTCRAHARKHWIRRKLFAAWAERRSSEARQSSTADDAAVGDEQATLVREAVAQLPTKNREAIVLCYLQGMTPAEAAEALGATRGAVEVRLSRGREQLRKLLAFESRRDDIV